VTRSGVLPNIKALQQPGAYVLKEVDVVRLRRTVLRASGRPASRRGSPAAER